MLNKILIGLSMLTIGCGQVKEMCTKKVERFKDYRICSQYQPERFQGMIERFNKDAGTEIFKWDCLLPSINIKFVDEIDRDEEVIGLGGVTYKHRKGLIKDTIVYSMTLILEKPFVDNNNDQKVEGLLYHELGHGLGLDHSADKNDLMYPMLQPNWDVELFFSKVVNIFNQEVI